MIGWSASVFQKFRTVNFRDNVLHVGNWMLAKVVGEEHFGGFLTKVDSSSASDDKKKTWKENMEEIISRSKKAKVN